MPALESLGTEVKGENREISNYHDTQNNLTPMYSYSIGFLYVPFTFIIINKFKKYPSQCPESLFLFTFVKVGHTYNS